MSDYSVDDEYDAWAGVPPPDDLAAMPEAEAPPPEGIIPLGHNRGAFFYYSRAGRQIVAIAAAQHSENTLMGIASAAHYWERSKFVGTKGGIQWKDAIDWMMSECRRIGIFDPAKIRGRGAWIDGGRAVLHAGDCLIVDGVRAALDLPDSPFVYEAAIRLGQFRDPPLATREAHKLMLICQRLSWEHGISATLMAGFLAVAPVCGALAWRPSCWLTGASDSGKTWVQENIAGPILAGIALRVQSKTTESGLRQALGTDARPVTFEEAEGEGRASAERIQGVLDLVRQASSETGGAIIKGTQNQSEAKVYRIRSSFFFASINVGIVHKADESRITVLTLAGKDRKIIGLAFDDLKRDVAATITEAYAAALVARSVRLLPVILANAETFGRAVTAHHGSTRAGQQLGALLAGAYSLHSHTLISDMDASAYVARQEWGAAGGAGGDTEADERSLLTHLTQALVRVNGGQTPAIERLISAAWGDSDLMSADAARIELHAIGIRPDDAGIFVSATHPALKKMLDGTPWATGWNRALSRLPGAEDSRKAMRFGRMHIAKAVFLPRTLLEV